MSARLCLYCKGPLKPWQITFCSRLHGRLGFGILHTLKPKRVLPIVICQNPRCTLPSREFHGRPWQKFCSRSCTAQVTSAKRRALASGICSFRWWQRQPGVGHEHTCVGHSTKATKYPHNYHECVCGSTKEFSRRPQKKTVLDSRPRRHILYT